METSAPPVEPVELGTSYLHHTRFSGNIASDVRTLACRAAYVSLADDKYNTRVSKTKTISSKTTTYGL